jgi:hypothetical protein
MIWFVIASTAVHAITMMRLSALSSRLYVMETTGRSWRENL